MDGRPEPTHVAVLYRGETDKECLVCGKPMPDAGVLISPQPSRDSPAVVAARQAILRSLRENGCATCA